MGRLEGHRRMGAGREGQMVESNARWEKRLVLCAVPAVSGVLVGGELASLHGLSIRAGHIGRLRTLRARHNIELHLQKKRTKCDIGDRKLGNKCIPSNTEKAQQSHPHPTPIFRPRSRSTKATPPPPLPPRHRRASAATSAGCSSRWPSGGRRCPPGCRV